MPRHLPPDSPPPPRPPRTPRSPDGPAPLHDKAGPGGPNDAVPPAGTADRTDHDRRGQARSHGPGSTGSPPPAEPAQEGAPEAAQASDQASALALPHERDESVGATSTGQTGSGEAGFRQRQVMRQAAQDLAQGQVDTDLHATPGLDAERRDALLGPAPLVPPTPPTPPATRTLPTPRPKPQRR